MKRSGKSIFILVALVCATTCASLALFACASQPSTSSSNASQELVNQKTDSDNILEYTCEEEFNYYGGIHHAEIIIEGYEDRPLELEIYSHSAPMTAAKFCRLVDRGYYNGKPIFWILDEMYTRVGNPEQDNNNLITGEYEESDVSNSNSLKRGVVAMNRAVDGQQSDASSFIIFMSDLSFLDGKYAGFGKITENYEVIEEIAKKTKNSDWVDSITIDDNGRIIDPAQYPIIKSITMID